MSLPGPVTLVQVGAEAAVLLADLHAAAFHRPGDETWTRKSFADVLRLPGSFCLVASIPAEMEDAPDEPIGFACVRCIAVEAELLSLGVVPSWQRAGVAGQLVQAAMKQAAQFGIQSMYLEVAEDNQPGQALYSGLDFQPVGRRKGYYARLKGKRVDAITMKRVLAAL